MTSDETDPAAQTTILHFLCGWRYNVTKSLDLPDELNGVIQSHSMQRWILFFEDGFPNDKNIWVKCLKKTLGLCLMGHMEHRKAYCIAL